MLNNIPSNNLNQAAPLRAIPYGRGQKKKIARINIRTLEVNELDLNSIINQTGHDKLRITAELAQTYRDWASC